MQPFSLSLRYERFQARLLVLAGLFLALYSLTLTLSPAARLRSFAVEYRWQHWLGFAVWLVAFGVAHFLSRRLLPKADPYLLPVVALLSGWGLLTIWRLLPEFGMRQSLWLAVSVGAVILGMRLPGLLPFLRRYKYLWLSGGILLTALTLIFGTNPTTGSSPRLWLGCCGIYFQPSEPLKLLLIIYLAAFFADRQMVVRVATGRGSESPEVGERFKPQELLPEAVGRIRLLPLLAPTLLMIGLTLSLLVVQRDLGTGMIFIFLFAVMAYLATGRILIVVISAAGMAAAAAAGYMLFGVVRLRIDAWLNPWLDPSGGSYQIIQSLLALANGGVGGRGPGLGSPGLVPVPHSDFIFSAIVEESGLLGALGLTLLLALFSARALRSALRGPDIYQRLLVGGLTAYLIGQSILIAGGNLRMMPLTGVTLPFVSYGGSSLLTAFLSLLILLQVSHNSEARPALLPGTRPYLHLGAFLLTGLAIIALLAGWWGYYRGPKLLERTDNPRRAIADRFVYRGSLLDRAGRALAVTRGASGDLSRIYNYAPLSPVIGYNHAVYGQSGLEASLDPYLRGVQGNPVERIWWNHVLYGHPPPGVDIRLSLDLDLQERADSLLGDRVGAIVLLNAESGEVLAMASHPFFDPNQLDERGEGLIDDPEKPLLNRAMLGQYPVASALGPFVLARAAEEDRITDLAGISGAEGEALQRSCARAPESSTLPAAVAAGCTPALARLAASLGEVQVLDLYRRLSILEGQEGLSLQRAMKRSEGDQLAADIIPGLPDLTASPLEMAQTAATLGPQGAQPASSLVVAMNSPSEGWISFPEEENQPRTIFRPASAKRAASLLTAAGNLPIWQSVALAPNGTDRWVTWYLGGTLPSAEGAPLALAVLLEEKDPALAQAMGRALLQAALPYD